MNIQEKDHQINIKQEDKIIGNIITIIDHIMKIYIIAITLRIIGKVDFNIKNLTKGGELIGKGKDLMGKKDNLKKEIIIKTIKKNIKLING